VLVTVIRISTLHDSLLKYIFGGLAISEKEFNNISKQRLDEEQELIATLPYKLEQLREIRDVILNVYNNYDLHLA
jgi:hypothetical protein